MLFKTFSSLINKYFIHKCILLLKSRKWKLHTRYSTKIKVQEINVNALYFSLLNIVQVWSLYTQFPTVISSKHYKIQYIQIRYNCMVLWVLWLIHLLWIACSWKLLVGSIHISSKSRLSLSLTSLAIQAALV